MMTFESLENSQEAPLIDPAVLPSWILYEDEHLLVVNKPGDIVCHPSKNGPYSSLVGAVREYLGLETIHLVHRLDRETSGIVVLAKDKKFARLTQMAFQNREVDKTYLGILDGELAEPVLVNRKLARDMESPVYVKQTVRNSNSAQSAKTRFEPISVADGFTFVKIVPLTGRKHQIRAHASWLGTPLVGDKVYGPDDRLYLQFIETGWREEMREKLKLPRQALHASVVTFRSPGITATYTAPFPPDMQAFCLEHGLETK